MNEIVKTQNIITPMDMLNKAVESNADLDKLSKLMDLQERWEKNEAKKEYVIAMSKFRAECPAIDKTKQAHNSKYAGLSETIEQIKGLLSECGLSHSWRTSQDDKTITVTCVVTHITGHSETTSLSSDPDTSGNIKGIQAIASTVSYLQRYTLFSILGLASKDMDDDGKMGAKFITPTQLTTLLAEADDRGVVIDKLCEVLRISSMAGLTESRFNEALQKIRTKVKK